MNDYLKQEAENFITNCYIELGKPEGAIQERVDEVITGDPGSIEFMKKCQALRKAKARISMFCH